MPKRKPKPTPMTTAEACERARAARSLPDGCVSKTFAVVASVDVLDKISDMTPVERGEILSSRLTKQESTEEKC